MSPGEWEKNLVLLGVARELALRPVGWGVNVSLRTVEDLHPKNGSDDSFHRDFLNLALLAGGNRPVDPQPFPMSLVEQMALDQNLKVLKYDFFLYCNVVGFRNRTGAERGPKYEIRSGFEGSDGVRFAHDLAKVMARKIVYVESEIFFRMRFTTFFEHGKSGFTFCGCPVHFCTPNEGLYWVVPKPEAWNLLLL